MKIVSILSTVDRMDYARVNKQMKCSTTQINKTDKINKGHDPTGVSGGNEKQWWRVVA